MATEYSNKVILITENNRIMTPIRHALNKQGMELAVDFLNLHSISSIRKAAARTGRMAFMRAELMRFIKERGFPAAIIMDGQVDLGFDSARDPEQVKHLKALMITYIILGKGKEFGHCRGNFIIITKGKSFEERFHLGSGPQGLLELLKTDSDVINSYIDEMKEDALKFNERFFIKLMDSGLPSDAVTDFIETFIRKVNTGQSAAGTAKKNIGDAAKDEARDAAIDDAESVPARIVYRIDGETLYDDGTIGRIPDELTSLRENEFYLIGSWTSKTELEVTRKIAAIIQKGLGDKKRFSYNDEIVFNIDDRCMIDKNTTLSMAQLFTKNLAPYKKIAVHVGGKHGKIVEKSRGYPMIREKTVFEQGPAAMPE